MIEKCNGNKNEIKEICKRYHVVVYEDKDKPKTIDTEENSENEE